MTGKVNNIDFFNAFDELIIFYVLPINIEIIFDVWILKKFKNIPDRYETFACRCETFACRSETSACGCETSACGCETFACGCETFACRSETFACGCETFACIKIADLFTDISNNKI